MSKKISRLFRRFASIVLGLVLFIAPAQLNECTNMGRRWLENTVMFNNHRYIGVAQTITGLLSSIHGFTIYNPDATTISGEPLWYNPTGTAVIGGVGPAL
jgi:hypothetical protein